MSTLNVTHAIKKDLIDDYVDHKVCFTMVSFDIWFAKPCDDEHSLHHIEIKTAI